jgi:O-antigen/teichoic acid export membrane protein
LIFGIGSVVNSAFGLVLVPVYGRYLKAGEFGTLALLMPTLTLVAIILKAGLNHAFFRHYYDTDDSATRRKIVGSTLIFLLFASTAATLLLSSVAPQVSGFIFAGDVARADLLRLVFYTSFFEVITLIPDSILRVKFKSAQYSTLNIIAFVVQLSLICYLVLGVDPTAHSVLLGRLIGSAFEAALFFWMVRSDLSLSFSGRELRGMLAFGAPLIFGQVSFHLFIMIDRFFLEHYTTSRELGAYGMACTLVSAVGILVTVPFSQVWTVMRFSVMNEEGAEEYYSRVLTYIVLVSMFFALGVAAVGGDGLLLFATKGYWAAALMIPLLAMASVFDSASRVLNIGITLRKRTMFAPLVIVAGLAVNISLNFWLIPRYGAIGASVATLISYIAFCAFRYSASNLFFKVRYQWGRVFTLLGVGGVLISCFYLNDYLRGESPSRTALYLSVLTKGLLAVSFPLLLMALRFYDERERRRIAEICQRAYLVLRRRGLTEA